MALHSYAISAYTTLRSFDAAEGALIAACRHSYSAEFSSLKIYAAAGSTSAAEAPPPCCPPRVLCSPPTADVMLIFGTAAIFIIADTDHAIH